MKRMGSEEKKKVTVYLGNISLLKRFNVAAMSGEFDNKVKEREEQGETTIYIVISVKDKVFAPGCFTLKESHESKGEAIEVIKYLKKKNYDIWMITGDNWGSALMVGKALGIEKERILAQARPKDKKSKVE